MSRTEIGTYEDIRGWLRVRLADRKTGRSMRERTVWEPVDCGYALAAYLALPEEVLGGGIANVPRGLLEASGVSGRRAMADALAGSVALDLPKLTTIENMLFGDRSENLFVAGDLPEDGTLLVLTTEEGVLGASVLFYPNVQEQIGRMTGGDYYVLPSSVHEVLIMPDTGRYGPEELAAMVRAVNEKEVSPEERLGNRVLRYRADLGRLQVAADMDRSLGRGRERG